VHNQEAFWSGPEGKDYLKRNPPNAIRSLKFFEKALRSFDFQHGSPIRSALEFGANDGRNLTALRMFGVSYCSGVEINQDVYMNLLRTADSSFCQSILDFHAGRCWDLVLTKGCLIHIAPEEIHKALKVVYDYAFRYILLAEYHSPRYEELLYRGRKDLLWKGPYAEDMIKEYGLKLRDYGFISRLDEYPEDDLTWFLLEKN
jgi:pseudaminic acid biosynthesis-associated methylase